MTLPVTPTTTSASTAMPVSANTAAAAVDLNERLPLDSAIRTGKLDNGLTYYIRKNANQPSVQNSWLTVNAGSVMGRGQSKGPGALSRTHALQRHATLPKPGAAGLSPEHRHEVRAGHQCLHVLRRNGLYAANPDRRGPTSRRRLMCCRIGPGPPSHCKISTKERRHRRKVAFPRQDCVRSHAG